MKQKLNVKTKIMFRNLVTTVSHHHKSIGSGDFSNNIGHSSMNLDTRKQAMSCRSHPDQPHAKRKQTNDEFLDVTDEGASAGGLLPTRCYFLALSEDRLSGASHLLCKHDAA